MAANKYAGKCAGCGESVGVGAGALKRSPAGRWYVKCAECGPAAVKEPRGVSWVGRLSSGAEIYQNRRGRCEDAPCCGCCNC